MATTVLQIMENGLAMSALNRPEILVSNAVELVRIASRAQVALFAYAAKVNPGLIGATQDVAFNGTGWTRPALADAVWRIEGLGGTTTPATTGEVNVVPLDDRALATPAVYRMGQQYYGAGGALDPAAGSLRFFFAARPATLTATGDAMDPRVPDAYFVIYELETALYLARKDGSRPADAGPSELDTLTAERDRWVNLFADWCDHETMNETRRFDLTRRFVTEARVALKAALTPGGG